MIPRRARGPIVLALVFVLGGAAGGGLVFATLRRHETPTLDEDGIQLAIEVKAGTIAKKLELDADQRVKLQKVIGSAVREDLRLRREIGERCGQPLRDEKVRVDGEIRAFLRPDQLERYDAWRKTRASERR